MQADDQSARSPPHSLSLDHDVTNQPLPLPSGRYNSLNMHFQSKSSSQEGMLLSLPADYSTADSRQFSYKNQTRKVMKRQAANIDDAMSSLPYPSYDDNQYTNTNTFTSSKDALSYNSYGRFPLTILESNVKSKDYAKLDNPEYREDARKIANGANSSMYSVEINDGVKKGNAKAEAVFNSTGHKYEKNYKPDTKSIVKNDKLSNAYLCDVDFAELDAANNESSDRSYKLERKITKIDTNDSSASKIYESILRSSNNPDESTHVGDKNKNGKIVNTYLYNVEKYENEKLNFNVRGISDRSIKIDKQTAKLDEGDQLVAKLYESMAKCSNDINSLNSSFTEKAVKKSNLPYMVLGNHYVDMGSSFKDYDKKLSVVNSKDAKNEADDKKYVYSRVMPESSNIPHNVRRKSDRALRRHTTEYRGPPHLMLPALTHDSSDSAEISPVVKPDAGGNYHYSLLPDQKIQGKKCSATSSTSEENSDAIATALKVRMQAKDWRDNKPQRKVDSSTVDRKSTSRKNASKSAKIKRRGSLNIIDPTTGLHVSSHPNQENFNYSMRNHTMEKTTLVDARKKSLQISAEDMVQIANCGARNKNGSLCHFISTNNDNYISISQALLDQSSTSEFKIPENKTPVKQHTLERILNRKSTHSLVLGSSDDTLCREDLVNDLKNYLCSKQFENENVRVPNKFDSVDRCHKGHSRQRSHDLGKSLKSNKQKQDPSFNKKITTKNEGQSSYKPPTSYYLLQSDVCPNKMTDNVVQRKDNMKFSNSSSETLDKSLQNNECRCLAVSNHSLIKTDSFGRDEGNAGNNMDGGNMTFRRFGNSSREELANSEDVEETFDF